MDTNSLKRFSTEARVKLKTGVAMMMQQLGFDAEGHVASMPERIGGGAILNGAVISDDRFYDRWMSLYHAIQLHGVREVYEEVAYTWFNRFIAIRIMRMNGFISPVLEYQSQDVRIPCIVANARRGIIPPMPEQDRRRLDDILLDDSKTSEQFAILIVAYCHNNSVLSRIFGRVNDYTALLLPKSILAPGDFVDMLNNTPFIKPEDYKQSELIGWLYQFYISEKKDEVFAAFKNGSKAEAEDIPAATQIFTPNWIVKYMVQNTLGRIYLDNNPGSQLKEKWDYLVPQSEGETDTPKLRISELEELTLLDPGSGSGHILVEGFDMLYDMYAAEFASPREACEAILTKNITGIDIDTRAKQLAQFSLLMKACQKDDSFLDAKVLPRVYDMPEPWGNKAGLYELLKSFFARDDRTAIEETIAAITLMDQAKNLGSIMKFVISDRTRFQIERRMKESLSTEQFRLVPYFNVILALTGKYAAVCANPPYMGSNNMNDNLKEYVYNNYAAGKADLCTTFVLIFENLAYENGKYSFIIPPSWLFLSSFEDLRDNIINYQTIDSLLHLSRGVFGADFGSSAAVITNRLPLSSTGNYYRLINRTFQEFDQTHLKALFELTLKDENFRYDFQLYSKDSPNLYYSEKGSKIFYSNVPQSCFERIPGKPIGYWVSDSIIQLFTDNKRLELILNPHQGMKTLDNDRFTRYWPEISKKKMSPFGGEKWYPFNDGGGFRKWYGLNNTLVNWENDGEEIKALAVAKYHSVTRTVTNIDSYFKPGITWSVISSGSTSFRCYGEGFLFSNSGQCMVSSDENLLHYIAGLLNTNIFNEIMKILSPTMGFESGYLKKMPVVFGRSDEVVGIVSDSISISKEDWDSHEGSWDFGCNELITTLFNYMKDSDCTEQSISLDVITEKYKNKWEGKFNRLLENDKKINEIFIDVYKLYNEVSPYVKAQDISILQQGEITLDEEAIIWHDDVIVKQLISYLVGCYMGRYRLDRQGLAIAHPDATVAEKAPYRIPGTSASFTIDDDALIPLLPATAGFSDNGVQLIRQSIMDVFGSKNYVANLNYIENCLGKPLEDYMAKDFWNDHKKMYQNRPIYWLFSSKKGAFKVIAYMHRMTKYTVEQVRQKYLLPYIDKLKGQAEEIQAKGAGASSSERRSLQGLLKNIAECEEYHTRLHSVAEKQISFDLDDGVIKNYALFGDILAKIK